MTIIEASNLLFEFFKKNDAYHKKDFLKLVLVSENPEKDESAINLALQDYEKAEILNCIELKGEKIYVLKKSLDSFNQTISISSPVATAIRDLINNYCSLTNNKTISCDAKNLDEDSIKNLYFICSFLISNAYEKIVECS